MASPAAHSWPVSAGHPQHQQQQQQHQPQAQQRQHQQGHDDMGLQTRPMGLKVHYTFDRDGQINCLARWPHILTVQTVPLDEFNTIGVVDLRTCLEAIAQCSPEIINQQENDYSVYAYDYSEPDTPLVGQGMLSRGLDSLNDQAQQQQLVTGRVTRSLLAILSNGSRETLEVKMKLTAVARMQLRSGFSAVDVLDMSKLTSTPVDTTSSEWNSFLQSNPMLGHAGNIASIPSPALPPARLNTATSENRAAEPRREFSHYMSGNNVSEPRPQYPQYTRENSTTETGPGLPQYPNENREGQTGPDSAQYPPARPSSIPPVRPSSIPPPVAPVENAHPPASANPPPTMATSVNAPSPGSTTVMENGTEIPPAPGSRPASRARRSRATGRPKGRPRKNPVKPGNGNTSAAEEPATDGDDGPQKKRVKVTPAEYNAFAPFGTATDSLRVAASTSGSLRNMRPVGAVALENDGQQGQDIPRAPTPVPDMSRMPKHHMRRGLEKSKSEAMMDSASGLSYQSRFSQAPMQRSMSMDALSPESAAQTPDAAYTPEDSPGDIGSSPPVPRTRAYMRTSPVASSPILPPLPLPQVDSGFMSGGIDDFFDDDQMLQDLPQEPGQELPQRSDVRSKQAPQTTNPAARNSSLVPPNQSRQNFPFQAVNPGPPELLPSKSIYNPTARARCLQRAEMEAASLLAEEQQQNTTLKRVTTDPNPIPSEREQERSVSQQPSLEQGQDGDVQMAEAPMLLPPPEDQSQSVCLPGSQQQHTDGSFTLPDSQRFGQVVTNLNDSQQTLNGGLEVAVTEAPNREISEPVAEPPKPPKPLPVPERPTPKKFLTLPSLPVAKPLSKTALSMAQAAVPASDPVPEPALTLPQPFMSEAPYPPSDAGDSGYSKNIVKKNTIKERLEIAIEKGEMPPFCNNCGAIETPTWRKIWTQEHQGVPGFHEFSDKPGMVTMIDILKRDEEGKPLAHVLVKKNLGPKDNKQLWKETLLCNPCGIWLTKFKSHRPPDRWDKDAARLNQPRRKRSKKPRSKSDGQMNLTSEAYFATDPIGPGDQDLLKLEPLENEMTSRRQSVDGIDGGNDQGTVLNGELLNCNGSPKQSRPGSTHSRGSGTADSPIAIEDDLGPTRRLLFPSPRKDGVPKVLGELTVNLVQTTTVIQEVKSAGTGKENQNPAQPVAQMCPATPIIQGHDDFDKELFGTPPRPSTPPPKSVPGPFKTPTRATPSHRPVTRSISRSIAMSPGQALLQLQRTPSRTPRSTRANNTGLLFALGSGSTGKRRSPRHAHFVLDEDLLHTTARFTAADISPFSASLRDLLSEANDFTSGSTSHGFGDLDLTAMPNIDSDDQSAIFDIHLRNLLSTEMVMPSSPPLTRNDRAAAVSTTFSAGATAEDLWAQMSASITEAAPEKEENKY
ncbi:hypothetical protein V8F33_006438 [Rhypophila sp. PSN 637]